MPTQDPIVVGLDGIDRVERIALRAIPELLTGTDPGRFDAAAADARQEVHDFVATHKVAIASASIDQLRGIIRDLMGHEEPEYERPTDSQTTQEVLDSMGESVERAADAADEIVGQRELIGRAVGSLRSIARGAVAAGLSAVVGMVG